MLIPEPNCGRLGKTGSEGKGGGNEGSGGKIVGNVGSVIFTCKSNVGKLGMDGSSGRGGGKERAGIPGNGIDNGKLHLLI
jgi:hypothetical protein